MEQFPILGALPARKDVQAYKVVSVNPKVVENLPDEFDLKMCEVKNQSSVSSCVAHAMSEIIEYFNKSQEKSYVEFSTGFIYGNRSNTLHKGEGMYVDKALDNAKKIGDVPNVLFPYNVEVPKAISMYEEKATELKPKAYPNRITEYFKLQTDEQMKVNLIENGPILFSIPWYADYEVDGKTKIMNHVSNDIRGYHAMVIYGWNKDGWKFQNSWGTGFGNKGRAILPYGTKFDTCYGVRDEIIGESDLDIDKPLRGFPKWIISIINFILNLFNRKK